MARSEYPLFKHRKTSVDQYNGNDRIMHPDSVIGRVAAFAAREQLDTHQRRALDKRLQRTPPQDVLTIMSLLDQGADPNSPPEGRTNSILYTAASVGEVLTIAVLFDRGALIDANGGPYHTALKGAILVGQFDTTVTLLEYGADVNHCNSFSDVTPLGLAIRERHPDLVAMLLKYGAKVNAPIPNPVALLEIAFMHKTQKPSCKKGITTTEDQEHCAIVRTHGGRNSAKEDNGDAADWSVELWEESDKEYDFDSDFRRVVEELEQVKKRKKDRKRAKQDIIAHDRGRNEGGSYNSLKRSGSRMHIVGRLH